jgi:beta-1,4-mannosyl-glycoprotein beta-1,4-N-acetylglucosaminyltransferase
MVYDCFTFFNEHDLLEIRLNTLDSVVDYFVIVEADRTFTNKPKEFEFQNNSDRFKAFKNKIIHIMVNDFPEYTGDPWVYERFQRNAIMRGLKDCKPDDTIIISDVDEILSVDAVNRCKEIKDSVCFFKLKHYYVYLNFLNIKDPHWLGPVSLKYKDLTIPDYIRNCRLFYEKSKIKSFIKKFFYVMTLNLKRYNKWNTICKHIPDHSCTIENAGWHFSYCGGIDKIILKIKSCSHQEINTSRNIDSHHLNEQIKNKTFSLYSDNDRNNLQAIQIDNTYPEYLQNNIQKYAHLVFSE